MREMPGEMRHFSSNVQRQNDAMHRVFQACLGLDLRKECCFRRVGKQFGQRGLAQLATFVERKLFWKTPATWQQHGLKILGEMLAQHPAQFTPSLCFKRLSAIFGQFDHCPQRLPFAGQNNQRRSAYPGVTGQRTFHFRQGQSFLLDFHHSVKPPTQTETAIRQEIDSVIGLPEIITCQIRRADKQGTFCRALGADTGKRCPVFLFRQSFTAAPGNTAGFGAAKDFKRCFA